MSKIWKIALLSISIFLYTLCVEEYIFILMFLTMITIYASIYSTSKYHSIIAVGAIIVGFITLKWLTINTDSINLPLGYSVFAFSAISLIVDSRKQSFVCHNMLDAVCYLFFFPRMMAGPLISFNKFVEELNKRIQRLNVDVAYKAFKIIVYATFCKFVLADTLGRVCFEDYNGINGIVAIAAFAIQLYLDFYAYSNYVIGLALLIGIRLPISFNSPYKANTFCDFWKRWNITVSEWLRNYVYIPLGGKHSSFRLILIMITFAISGLWHDFTLPFILWGLCHGVLVVIEKKVYCYIEKYILLKLLYKSYVIIMIAILWQLFKVDSIANFTSTLSNIFMWNSIYDRYNIIIVLLGLVTMCFIDTNKCKLLIFESEAKLSYIKLEVALLSIMLLLIFLFPYSSNVNFFYFKF